MDVKALKAHKHGLEMLISCKEGEITGLSIEIGELNKKILELEIPFSIGDRVKRIKEEGHYKWWKIGIYGGVCDHFMSSLSTISTPEWIIYEEGAEDGVILRRGFKAFGYCGADEWTLCDENKSK